MPYQIRKSGSGYKVFKKGTKKSFSKKPLTKIKAAKQMKALYASESFNGSLNFEKLYEKLMTERF